MLTSLGIRNVVLIDRLDLTFDHGLSVLTGETGAGKSILLDALGLATGTRAEGGLVRHGANGQVLQLVRGARRSRVKRDARRTRN